MASVSIDTSELEYLKSCRDKLRDITDFLKEEKSKETLSAEEKIKEIKKMLKQYL